MQPRARRADRARARARGSRPSSATARPTRSSPTSPTPRRAASRCSSRAPAARRTCRASSRRRRHCRCSACPSPRVTLLGPRRAAGHRADAEGIPVATFAVGKAGAGNAGLFAVAILAGKRPELAEKLVRMARSPGGEAPAERISQVVRVLAAPSRRLHGTSRSVLLCGVQPLRPLANPPNPWATTDVEYLDGEAPHAPLAGLRGPHPRHPLAQRQPGRRLRLERQPVPRLLSRLRLLLRPPLARVPVLRRRHRLRAARSSSSRARPSSCARPSTQPDVEGRARRLQRRHRLLPAARGQLPAHARLPRGVRRVPEPRAASSPSRRSSSATSTCSQELTRVARVVASW